MHVSGLKVEVSKYVKSSILAEGRLSFFINFVRRRFDIWPISQDTTHLPRSACLKSLISRLSHVLHAYWTFLSLFPNLGSGRRLELKHHLPYQYEGGQEALWAKPCYRRVEGAVHTGLREAFSWGDYAHLRGRGSRQRGYHATWFSYCYSYDHGKPTILLPISRFPKTVSADVSPSIRDHVNAWISSIKCINSRCNSHHTMSRELGTKSDNGFNLLGSINIRRDWSL